MELTCLDLFSGIGGFALAAKALDIKTKQFVECDRYCQSVLQNHFPGIPIHNDVRTFTARTGLFGIITAGYPCFAGGSMVLTVEGYKPIESIQVGELVLTHLGRWMPVLRVMSRRNAPLRKIQAQGVLETLTTDEHPYFAIKRVKKWCNADRKYTFSFTEADWIEAKDLAQQHFVTQVLPQEEENEFSADFWALVGLYLADGWRVKRHDRSTDCGRVVICANKKQANRVEEIISNAGLKFYKSEERTVFKYHIVNTEFYRFLEQFGHKAEGKTIPGWVLSISQDRAKALIDGYLFGDGWVNQRGYFRITTISKKLALGVSLLFQRAYNCVATVSYTEVPNSTWIEGRKVNQKPQYTIQATFSSSPQFAFVDGIYGWKRIKWSRDTGTVGTVYNLEVDGDNSYVVNNAVVHNCQDNSTANPKGKGLQGERSGLLYEVFRILEEAQPSIVILENVPPTQNRRWDETARRELEKRDFKAYRIDLSAKDCGLWHLRKRCFLVGYASRLRLNSTEVLHQFSRQAIQAQIPSRRADGIEFSRGDSGRVFAFPPPGIRRVADGIPSELDKSRLHALGNSVPPVMAETVLRTALTALAA